jgi:hypothetical protein
MGEEGIEKGKMYGAWEKIMKVVADFLPEPDPKDNL